MNLGNVKKIFLARLANQPDAFSYPAHILRKFTRIPSRLIGPELVARQSHHSIYQAILLEWRQAKADYLSMLRHSPARISKLIDWHANKQCPLDYLLGHSVFMGLQLYVAPPVLIPRHDTEIWLMALLKGLSLGRCLDVLEIGTGTGCIALAMATSMAHPQSRITAIDISAKAVHLARCNLAKLEASAATIQPTIQFKVQDVFKLDYDGHQHDIIISNPPYIRRRDWPNRIGPSVRLWEDKRALLGDLGGDIDGSGGDGGDGIDGISFYPKILDIAKTTLAKMVAVEIDGTWSQAQAVSALFSSHFTHTRCIKDWSLRPRAIFAWNESFYSLHQEHQIPS